MTKKKVNIVEVDTLLMKAHKERDEARAQIVETNQRLHNLEDIVSQLYELREKQNGQMAKMVGVLESLNRSILQIESNTEEPAPGIVSFAVLMDRLKGVEERIDKLERQGGSVVVGEVFAAAAEVVELTRHGLAIGEANVAVRRLRRALESVPKLPI